MLFITIKRCVRVWFVGETSYMLDKISKELIAEADIAFKKGHLERARILIDTVNKLQDEMVNRVMDALPNYITKKNIIHNEKNVK